MTTYSETRIDGLRLSICPDGWARESLEAIYSGMFEIAERRACKQLLKHGDVVVEFGTASGLVAMTASRIVGNGNVTSYEANPHLIPYALTSAVSNSLRIDFNWGAIVDRGTAGESSRTVLPIASFRSFFDPANFGRASDRSSRLKCAGGPGKKASRCADRRH